MYLTVTIDTEEDNWGEYDLPAYSVENIARIPRLQALFEARGMRPTYLISYPVATDARAIDILGGLRERGACEIGTHPHPWNTPPVHERPNRRNSFICNLPPALQYDKIKTLTDTIASNFGVRPTAYRSGRWGFDEGVALNLVRLGYRVDTSIFPLWDWSVDGGRDFSLCSHEPFVYRLEQHAGVAAGSLLEVPATNDFLQSGRALASRAFRSVKRLPLGGRLLGLLRRARALNHVCISPETSLAPDMIRLAGKLLERGTQVINMYFHSPTLLEGCSPFAKTPAEVSAFIERIEQFLAFASAAGLRPAGMSELRAADVGAARIKMLQAPETVAA
jgi:hypothetical protein